MYSFVRSFKRATTQDTFQYLALQSTYPKSLQNLDCETIMSLTLLHVMSTKYSKLQASYCKTKCYSMICALITYQSTKTNVSWVRLLFQEMQTTIRLPPICPACFASQNLHSNISHVLSVCISMASLPFVSNCVELFRRCQ